MIIHHTPRRFFTHPTQMGRWSSPTIATLDVPYTVSHGTRYFTDSGASRRFSRGFTLLEVLLSLLLLAVLLAGVWQVMSLYEQVFMSGHTRIESVQVVRSIHEQLGSDLRGAIPDVPGELVGASTIRRFGLFGTATSLQIDLIEVVPTQFVFDTTTTTDPYSEALSEVGGDSGSSGLISNDSSTGGGFGLDSTGGLLDTQSTESIAKRVPELSTVRWQFFNWTDFEAGEGLTLLDLLAINSGMEPINTPTGDSEAFTTGFLASDESTDSSDVLNGGGVSSSANSSANVSSISSSSTNPSGTSKSSSSGTTGSSADSTSGSSNASPSTVGDSSGGGASTRFRYNQNFAAASQNGDAILIGLVRRQIDWETPLDPASNSTSDSDTLSSSTEATNITSSTKSTSSNGNSTNSSDSSTGSTDSSSTTDTTNATDSSNTLDETKLANTLLGTEDSTSTSESGSSGMPTSALDQRRIRTIFHPDDPNVVWFPEVIGAEFHYYDGESWTTQWNSLTKRSLPVAVAVQLQILPRKALPQKDLLKLRAALLSGSGTSGSSPTSASGSSNASSSEGTQSNVDTLNTYGVLIDGMVIGEVDPDTGEYEMTASSSSGTSGTMTGSSEISGSISSNGSDSSGLSSISKVSSGGVSGGSVSTGTSSTTGEITGIPIVRGAKYYQFFLPLPSTALAKQVAVSATPSVDTEDTADKELQTLEIPTVALPTTESSGTTSGSTTDSDQWMRTQ